MNIHFSIELYRSSFYFWHTFIFIFIQFILFVRKERYLILYFIVLNARCGLYLTVLYAHRRMDNFSCCAWHTAQLCEFETFYGNSVPNIQSTDDDVKSFSEQNKSSNVIFTDAAIVVQHYDCHLKHKNIQSGKSYLFLLSPFTPYTMIITIKMREFDKFNALGLFVSIHSISHRFLHNKHIHLQ